jgi:APA family basic amino acid/polyamine antiporter
VGEGSSDGARPRSRRPHLPHLPQLPRRRQLPALPRIGGDRRLARRFLGVPWLFAVAFSAVGFSIYFSIGIVADRGLGLTPLIFLAAGIVFVLNSLTYLEGGTMFRERGGSSMFASHGFNELVSFVAGWAILLDFMIVIALAAISVPNYLEPVWGELAEQPGEIAVAVGVIAAAAAINIAGFTGYRRQRLLTLVALGGVALLVLVIAVGAITSWDLGAVTEGLDPFASPTLDDVIYASVIATVAYAGIEAASNLAPELEFEPADFRHLVGAAAVLVPALYTGMALIALMVVPVEGGAGTDLGDRFVEAPVLGVVMGMTPAWVADAMRVAVVAVAPAVLLWAASTSMLGLSRHAYTLARHRQIPSWLGKLSHRWTTPHVAILGGALIAVVFVLPGDVKFLAGVYAFGATIAFTIAHLAILRLRVRQPWLRRPFRVPFDVRIGGHALPLPAIAMAVLTALAWVSIVVFHEGARYIGGGWLLFGLGAYVFYRRVVEGTSLTGRVTVPEEALFKDQPEVEYGSILVPVFGTEDDDDIVSTAGRLAAAADEPGELDPAIDVIFVIELPLTIPLDAPPTPAQLEVAERALERAREIGSEYETVQVGTSMVRARSRGAGIVGEARRRGVDLVVIGAEPPTRIRGGALLGGIGGARPAEIGPVTEYVLKKAPCRVLLTAPPED